MKRKLLIIAAMFFVLVLGFANCDFIDDAKDAVSGEKFSTDSTLAKEMTDLIATSGYKGYFDTASETSAYVVSDTVPGAGITAIETSLKFILSTLGSDITYEQKTDITAENIMGKCEVSVSSYEAKLYVYSTNAAKKELIKTACNGVGTWTDNAE